MLTATLPAPAQKIQLALQSPLPGWEAHRQMFPPTRQMYEQDMSPQANYRESSVLVLLYPLAAAEDLHLALIKRTEYNGVHSGQISLPGGGREGDESLQTTALREAYEEVGIIQTELSMLGALSPLYIPPSNFLVYPFVAYQPHRPAFRLDPWEVAALIEAPLALLRDPANRCWAKLNHPALGEIEIPYFNVYGHQVWGATAMILSEFLAII